MNCLSVFDHFVELALRVKTSEEKLSVASMNMLQMLTHFIPLVSFCTPWKPRFSDVFRGYRKGLVTWNGLNALSMTSVVLFSICLTVNAQQTQYLKFLDERENPSDTALTHLTLPWWRSQSYRNQSIDLQSM